MKYEQLHGRILALEHLAFALLDASNDKSIVENQFLRTTEMTHTENIFSKLPEAVVSEFERVRDIYAQRIADVRSAEEALRTGVGS